MATESKMGGIKPLVIAVGVAVLGLLFMRRHLDAERKRLESSVDQVAVITVNQAVAAGDTIRGNQLSYRLVARDDQPWSTIKFDDPELSPDARRRHDSIVSLLSGRIVRRSLNRNEIVQLTDFEESAEERLSALFDGRLRGLAVQVDRASLMGGLLQPNDRVDVLATFPAGMVIHGGRAEAHDKTMVILEDVTVLAVGGRMAQSGHAQSVGGRGDSVVLALDPEQALLLSHVQKSTTISLLLRPMQSEVAGSFDKEREFSSPGVQESVKKIMDRSGQR